MKIYLTFIFCFLLQGCISASLGPESRGGTRGVRKDGLTQIENVFVGMTQTEVKVVMGFDVIIGYERKPKCLTAEAGHCFKSIALQSPYRKESLSNSDYDVWYYFTHIDKADGIVSNEELTPLIFENVKLIGKGWDFLFKLKNTLE
ncbi:hypothetical protein MNBD_UNCLBAC01-1674 [hydrothermal vent metagenome]|uniref:Lipoprotein n=1 Tax=hydrothermal vent metagenome TaxID=652676 RepID=A0A3B1DS09_9ZZZZ